MQRRVIGRITPSGYQQIEPATDDQKASFEGVLRDRTPPQIGGTDDTRFHRHANRHPFHGMVPEMQAEYMRQAEAMGISVSGKHYNASLVRPEYAGRFDPQALVGCTSDVEAVVKQNPGWEVDGIVKQKGREQETPPEPKQYTVAERIVEEEVVDELQANGVDRIGVKEFNDLKDKARSRLSGAAS